jgi:hypothetical protein
VSRSARARPRGPILVASTILGLLAAASLQHFFPDPSRPLPPEPPAPLVVTDSPAVRGLVLQGITLTTGWQPTGIIGAEDAWSLLDDTDGVAPWIERLPRLRIDYDGAGRLFVEDAIVVADPAHCYHLARVVRSVGVGLPPPVGPSIAAQLEAWLEPPYFSAVRSPIGRDPCSGGGRSQWGFAIEQAEPLPCVVPDRDVVCFTLAKWRHDFGARDGWTSTHRAFDVHSGERLSDVELHPALDIAALDVLIDTAVCALGGRCDGVPSREGRIHPTRTSLIVELSPGEAADATHGSLRLTIPRRALPLVTAAEGSR